jgi:hypothetical protein
MFEENLARIRTHRSNIHHYRNLLRSKLTDLERHFIGTRMADEVASLDALIAATFNHAAPWPDVPALSVLPSQILFPERAGA